MPDLPAAADHRPYLPKTYPFVGVSDLARRLEITRDAAFELIRHDAIPYKLCREWPHFRVHVDDVEAYVRQHPGTPVQHEAAASSSPARSNHPLMGLPSRANLSANAPAGPAQVDVAEPGRGGQPEAG